MWTSPVSPHCMLMVVLPASRLAAVMSCVVPSASLMLPVMVCVDSGWLSAVSIPSGMLSIQPP